MYRSRTYMAIPPGYTIRELLEDRHITQKEFAWRMGLSEKHICHLLKGEVSLTPDVAFNLELVLGVDASYWNRLEDAYREDIAKISAENEMDEDKEILKSIHFYNEMVEYGWVPYARRVEDRIINLRKFFSVSRLTVLPSADFKHVNFSRSKVADNYNWAFLAWMRNLEKVSEVMDVKDFSKRKLKAVVPEIRTLSLLDFEESCSRLQCILASVGIVFVAMPNLTGANIEGASFKHRGKIIMGVTANGRYLDQFWFTVFHEIAHILLEYPSIEADLSDEKSVDLKAENMIIAENEWKEFVTKASFSAEDIRRFALAQKLDTGLIIRRLQHSSLIDYGSMNDLRKKIEL